MNPLLSLFAGACFFTTALPALALDVLFVGNSFTFGNSTYNAAAINDANGTGHGGLPAAFKKLSVEGGYPDVNVTIEAVSGQTLAYHYSNKAHVLGKAWDYVVLQEHSLGPTTSGNVTAFRTAVQNIDALVKQHNASARVLLYETWARPDLVPGTFPTLSAMQTQLRTAYSAAAADFNLHGWVPVGEGYMQALDTGLAYNPTQGAQAGKFNLFVGDNYHPSGHGCYLAACLFYSKILGGDPRTLPVGAGSAAANLGVGAVDAANLQQIAYALVPPAPVPTAILAHPVSLTSVAGGKASFSVTAAGGQLAYQWRHNGVVLEGKTSATLQLDNVQAENAGLYDVVVTGTDGTATSNPAILTFTAHVGSGTWLIDLGAADAAYLTPSPDGDGRHWNQFTNAYVGSVLSPVKTSTGVDHASASVSVVTSFSGVNQGGGNVDGAYPATAQRDSFYVSGTGTTGNARKGEIQLAGLNTSGSYTLKLFGARAGGGSRVVRFTVAGLDPVFLETINNTDNSVIIGPVAPLANGTITLAVEPYDAAGVMQEYGYLGVIEVTESTPQATAYETWTSGHGLAAGAAAAHADPDGDGRSNLLEFALGTQPAVGDVGEPGTVLLDVDGVNFLSIRVQKNPAATGLTYAAEVSDDLVRWTEDAVVLADTAGIFQARDKVAVSTASRRFIRLKISMQP